MFLQRKVKKSHTCKRRLQAATCGSHRSDSPHRRTVLPVAAGTLPAGRGDLILNSGSGAIHNHTQLTDFSRLAPPRLRVLGEDLSRLFTACGKTNFRVFAARDETFKSFQGFLLLAAKVFSVFGACSKYICQRFSGN
jgi:hypothetical protein